MGLKAAATATKIAYTVFANGRAVYHGCNEDDARHIAWCRLLSCERVIVEANDWLTGKPVAD